MTLIRTATITDLPTVVETAARSLDTEAMLRWSLGEDNFHERVRRHFEFYDGETVGHGWVRVVEDGAGIAVWIPPESREENEAIPAAPPGEETEVLGDADRHATFWGWVEEHEPAEPLLYLSHIGVTPERQGNGLGTALLRDGLATADALGVPSWLETSRADNAAYYERFGFFTAVDEDAPDGGPHIWFMRRNPH